MGRCRIGGWIKSRVWLNINVRMFNTTECCRLVLNEDCLPSLLPSDLVLQLVREALMLLAAGRVLLVMMVMNISFAPSASVMAVFCYQPSGAVGYEVVVGGCLGRFRAWRADVSNSSTLVRLSVDRV